MKIEKIKPISQAMQRKIKALDKNTTHAIPGRTRFYAYLTKNDGELVKVTVAVKTDKKAWRYKQIAVHGVHSPLCFAKDTTFTYIAGYSVSWNTEDEWWYADDKYFDPFAPIINPEYISHFPEYKYSEYQNALYSDILSYLRLYEQFPEMEYLVKSGLKYYATSTTILKKMRKDKSFHKWLVAHKDNDMIAGKYYCNAILHAYANNVPIKQANTLEYRKRHLIADYHGKNIVKLALKKGVKDEYERFFAYLDKHKISNYLYLDYIRACNFLNLDCHDDKIRYPKDFHRWHDIRIEERRVVEAEQERLRKEKARKEKEKLINDFLIAAEKYLPLADFAGDKNYAIFIARSPAELVKEGNALSHCVGHNGYDKKMANQETLIFFVRRVEELDKPFVTLEYSLKSKKVLQCYGNHNSKPDQEILDFVNKKWLPYANKQLKNIAA